MATTRGCHKSAVEYQQFIYEDMADMVQRGYWVVLPYHAIQHLPNLRVSPIGCVPQRERRPRIIVDYTYSGVNAATDKQAHPEAMQFGGTLKRILHKILSAHPKYGPVYMLKIDLSDGFYRVPLRANDIPRLGVILPRDPNRNEDLVAFPLTLPMGWTESPPQFTAFTETIADLANRWSVEQTWDPPPHPLELLAASAPIPPLDRSVITVPPPRLAKPISRLTYQDLFAAIPPTPPPTNRFVPYRPGPLAYTDVYLDDTIQLAQGSKARLNRIWRTLLHATDLVFRPNDAEDTQFGRREPISAKNWAKVMAVGRPSKPSSVGKSTQSGKPSNSHRTEKKNAWPSWPTFAIKPSSPSSLGTNYWANFGAWCLEFPVGVDCSVTSNNPCQMPTDATSSLSTNTQQTS